MVLFTFHGPGSSCHKGFRELLASYLNVFTQLQELLALVCPSILPGRPLHTGQVIVGVYRTTTVLDTGAASERELHCLTAGVTSGMYRCLGSYVLAVTSVCVSQYTQILTTY